MDVLVGSPRLEAAIPSSGRRRRDRSGPFARLGSRRIAGWICLQIIILILAPLSAAEPLYHVLARGETLYSVARSYGISAAALEAANGIADPGKLRIGQRLLIPQSHRVAKGETLYGIAKDAGTSVAELRRLNGIAEGVAIKIGDVLLLPGSSGSGMAATASVKPDSSSQPPARTSSLTPPLSPATVPSSPSGGTEQPKTQVTNAPGAGTRLVPTQAILPCAGSARYLDGKLFGIAIKTTEGSPVKAVADGTVVSAGPYRGFGAVAFVLARNGLIFVYGGSSGLEVKVGDSIRSGQLIGRVGHDPLAGGSEAYFFVFKGSAALDPAEAPRN